MQSPSASDPSFKAFLEKLQEQNNRSFIAQLVQLKAEREIAGEDNDKREEQLDSVISSLRDLRSTVTGVKLDIDLTPLVSIGENQTKLLEEISKEASLTRKLTEGSVEYDKEAAQYRNTSGRDIESKVSGKTSKDGGFLDFETARDTLSGQGKRVREDNAFDLKPINYTPGKAVAAAVGGKGSPAGGKDEKPVNEVDTRSFFEVFKDELKAAPGRIRDNLIGYTPEKLDSRKKKTEVDGAGIEPNAPEPVTTADAAPVSAPVTAKPQVTGINPESDNIRDSAEIAADYEKEDIELSKQMLVVMREQLASLKTIQEALAPGIPVRNKDGKAVSPGPVDGSGGGGGGGGLPSGLGRLVPGMGGLGKGLMTAGKAVLPYAAAAGVAVAGGAAVDYGLGKLGVGKDKEGNDLKVDTAQDDANWKKMSMGQKIQSGVGRGIEKVGSALFLDNMSREAQADRVKNETEYFKDKDFVDSSKEQDEANYKKMSFGKKILSSINRGGEKLSLFDSTKTTAARIRKETEELNKDAPGAATKEALAPTPATVPAGGQPVAAIASMKDSGKAEKLSGIKKEFQESEAKETAAKTKIEEFEKANPFDYREKPPNNLAFLDMPGAGKFNDPKKQAEYNKLQKEKEAQQSQSSEIKRKYKEEDVGKDVQPMSATYAAQLNKQAEEANAAGRHPTGKPHKTDHKEGDEMGLSERGASRKYQGVLLEKGVAREDIHAGPFRAQEQYDKLLDKELRSEKVTGGPGAKDPVTSGAPAIPVIEKKSVDTAAPGKATVVASKETVDSKKVTPITDVDKAQQAAKGKYQASTSEEKAASEKLKAFEKENPFDYREKPTATQDFLEVPGTGKFKDPKKQEEYDKLKGTVRQASESKRSAGAAYTAAEGVTKTYEFTGGEQPSKPGAKGGIQDKIDSEIGGMQSDGAKIEALKKRGYTDKDLGRDDTLKQNYIGMSDGAKYPNKNLGLYEAIVKKELDAPTGNGSGTLQAGQVVASPIPGAKPIEAVSGAGLGDIANKPITGPTLGTAATPGAKLGVAVGVALTGGLGSKAGQEVAKTTTENTDMTREASRGGGRNNTIVSNNVNNNNTTKFVPMMPSARPEQTGSALDRFTNRISVYY